MPATASVYPGQAQRRPGSVTRGRENRPQTPNRDVSRAAPPPTPEPWSMEDATPRPETSHTARRRRKPNIPHPHAAPSANHLYPHFKSTAKNQQKDATSSNEPTTEHLRRPKGKHKLLSDNVEMVVIQDAQTRANGKFRRRDNSRSRENSHRGSVKATSIAGSDDEMQEGRSHTGPLAMANADHARLRSELEIWKKKAHTAEKRLNKLNEEFEKLHNEHTVLQESDAGRRAQLKELELETEKSTEMIKSIEQHMNCGICMELMTKPFGLSPCGHVLCQSCLQEWFRTAPAGEDDMFDGDTPGALLYRRKTCPVCRTVVRTRPIRLFLVESIANDLKKTKLNPEDLQLHTYDRDKDPWTGIFLDPADESTSEEEDESEYDEDEDEDDYDDYDQWSSDADADGYGSGSDSEPYNGSYIYPRWSPPTVHVSPVDLDYLDTAISGEEWSMLRRGCTMQMINLFDMHYTHNEGLNATVDGNTIYLGWNVRLLSEDDTGEEYMEYILRDIHEREDRWVRHYRSDGTWEAWRLVPDNDDTDYPTSDSEAWAADSAAEDLMDESEF